jgi:hypothetical protein
MLGQRLDSLVVGFDSTALWGGAPLLLVRRRDPGSSPQKSSTPICGTTSRIEAKESLVHDYLRPDALLFPIRAVTSEAVTVGRGEECDIQLTNPEVSKLHAELLKPGLLRSGWCVRDLDSTNGTWVVGGSGYAKVTTVVTAALRPGTEIRFGTVDGLFVVPGDFSAALEAARPAWKREGSEPAQG